jgi:hypothetical protein
MLNSDKNTPCEQNSVLAIVTSAGAESPLAHMYAEFEGTATSKKK